MFILSKSTRNIVFCTTTLLLTGFITGCSGSMTGTIGSTKQVEITTPTSVLSLTEGESANLEIQLPETSDKNVILRWILTNSDQGVLQKWLPQKINSILFSSVNSNFLETSGSLTVPADSSNIHFAIQSVNDGVFSSDMHFELTILGDDVTKSLIVPVLLADSDGLPELGVYDAYAVKGQKARVTMNLSYQSKIALPVTITSNNVSAVAGVDFEMTASSITIPPDTLEYSFEIETKLAGDTTEKSFDLTFTVIDPTKGDQEKMDVRQKVFTSAVNGVVSKTLTSAPKTNAPKRRIETTIRVILYDSSNQTKIAVNDATAIENEASAMVNIQLSQNATSPVAFDVKLENVTAKAGIDFSTLPQTRYTIPQGEKQIQIGVQLVNDQERNTNVRVFHLALSNLTGATYLRPKGLVTILPRDTVVEATSTPQPIPTSVPQPTSAPTLTPSTTPVFIPTPTPTTAPTGTPTNTPVATPIPTATPTPTPTSTVTPTASPTATLTPTPMNPNTVLYIDGEGTNGSTNITDGSPNTKILANANGVTSDNTTQKAGFSSLNFNSSNKRLNVTNPGLTDFNFGTGDFTIEFWVKASHRDPQADFAYQHFFGLAYGADQCIVLRNGNYGFYGQLTAITGTCSNFANIYTGTTVASNSDTLSQSFNHVALTRQSGTMRLFLNGVALVVQRNYFDGNNLTSWSFLDDIAGVTSVQVGPIGINGGAATAAHMDNIRVTKGTALYTTSFTPQD